MRVRQNRVTNDRSMRRLQTNYAMLILNGNVPFSDSRCKRLRHWMELIMGLALATTNPANFILEGML